jgi:hypothetical protein
MQHFLHQTWKIYFYAAQPVEFGEKLLLSHQKVQYFNTVRKSLIGGDSESRQLLGMVASGSH